MTAPTRFEIEEANEADYDYLVIDVSADGFRTPIGIVFELRPGVWGGSLNYGDWTEIDPQGTPYTAAREVHRLSENAP